MTTAAVAGRVLDHIEELLPKLAVAYKEVPEYAELPAGVMEHEVLPTSRAIVEAFLEAIIAGDEPDPRRLAAIPAMGRRRLELGVPLEPVLHVYRIASRVMWDEIVSATRPGDEAALAELGGLWMEYMDVAASIMAAAYLDASHQSLRAVDARRRALIDALLSAEGPAEVASVSIRFSTALATSYVPVLVEGDHASARIDVVLDAAPDGTIAGERTGSLLLLVPTALPDVNPLLRAAGPSALLAWSAAATPGPALLAEVGTAETLLMAARTAGITSGAYGPDDLLVEQLLAGNQRVAASLSRRVREALAGRDHDGLITSTLRTFLATGSVPDTARAEVVHPNTVLYRLKRVRELTGLDPRIPGEAALLVLGFRL
ncbi:MAG: hypothetical protein QOE35_2428 [Actinomycetota bacterium]|jgi:hypothetical protein